MRRAATAFLVLAAAAPAAADADAPAGWRPDVAAARAYAEGRAGSVAFAVRTERRVWGHRKQVTMRSASVVKAMLLAAYLDDRRVRDRDLTAADRALLAPMIRRSDNLAATRVRDLVGTPALTALARRVGMRNFRAEAVWGLSRITAADQTRFFLRLDRFIAARHRAYALLLLRTVVPAQRWGIGALRLPGWTAHFKGGWGSGTGLVDHQVALLRRGRERVAVAVLTLDNPSHAYGKATLRGVFARLLADLPVEG